MLLLSSLCSYICISGLISTNSSRKYPSFQLVVCQLVSQLLTTRFLCLLFSGEEVCFCNIMLGKCCIFIACPLEDFFFKFTIQRKETCDIGKISRTASANTHLFSQHKLHLINFFLYHIILGFSMLSLQWHTLYTATLQ